MATAGRSHRVQTLLGDCSALENAHDLSERSCGHDSWNLRLCTPPGDGADRGGMVAVRISSRVELVGQGEWASRRRGSW